MAEFSCAAAGATPCGWRTRASTEEELLAEVERHLREEHHVAHVTETLKKYVAAVARQQS